MLETIQNIPYAATSLGAILVLLGAYLGYLVTNRLVVRAIGKFVERTESDWDDALHHFRVFERLAHLAPALVVYYGAHFVPGLGDDMQLLIQRVTTAVMVVVVLVSLSGFLSAANEIYSKYPVARSRPIKGYLQVLKIVIFVLGAIAIVALLVDRSPLLLLSGVGALTAVLLLVFKDTILALVASIQITSNDMVRVGDWIEMPDFGADGDVIDIALYTVKVQNWDKTITAIPTHKLIGDSFKNWRGMSASGGRRIKRAIQLDIQSIRFLEEEDLQRFEKFEVLEEYIRDKKAAIEAANSGKDTALPANTRLLTNIGTFRAYIVGYLRRHPMIHDDMTFLVRQLEPTPNGVPIEIYVFSNDTDWIAYEGLQSDIFDHLLAVVPEFGLRVFQNPAGADFVALVGKGDKGKARGEK